jgi:sensor histidine kinase regulating citrate/malate metabolism
VIDSGEGISLENQESIFELGVSTKKGENRGIGLWFALTYIQELNGNIEVLSEGKGKGAEFRVVLPLLAKRS